MYKKSHEFFQGTSLVDPISLILLWSTVEQALHLLGAGVRPEYFERKNRDIRDIHIGNIWRKLSRFVNIGNQHFSPFLLGRP